VASEIYGDPAKSVGVPPFKVLALDGGGMRGAYTAMFLEQLTKRLDDERRGQLDLGAAFDLIVGTSTGGILACALAAGYPPSRIAELYRVHGPRIFKNPVPSSLPGLVRFAATHLRSPANDGSALRAALTETFDDETVGEVYARRGIGFCLQAVDIDAHAPVVLKTGHLPGKHRDDATTLVDVCLATSAAPIILPLAQIMVDGVLRTFADGGLWANSPITIGLLEAIKMCGDRPIHLISVGTCPPPTGRLVRRGHAAWGLLKWRFGVGAVEASLDAQTDAARYAFAQLFPALRMNAVLVRFHQTPPPADHQAVIGLDRADDAALEALDRLAARDADVVHSEITRQTSSLAFIADMFTSLTQI
jgi:predicted acylesterase/phospholipase RssA